MATFPRDQPIWTIHSVEPASLFNENLQANPRYASRSTDCEAVTSSWPRQDQATGVLPMTRERALGVHLQKKRRVSRSRFQISPPSGIFTNIIV